VPPAALIAALISLVLVAPPDADAAVPTIAEIVADFRTVFRRAPTVAEQEYWKRRRTDKPTRQALRGAMAYVKSQGKTIGAPVIKSPKDLAGTVPQAFASVFGRPPNTKERQYWVDRALCQNVKTYKALAGSLAYHKARGKTVGAGTKATFCAPAGAQTVTAAANAGLGIGGHAAGPLVRIGITQLGEIKVTASGNFFLRLPDNAKKVFGADDVVSVARKDGGYDVHGPNGYRAHLDSPPKLASIGGSVLEVVNYADRGASGRNYNRFRGAIEARLNSAKNALWAINELRAEDYVKGIGETTDNAPEAFRKALAVAARTYVLYHHLRDGRQPHNGFDIGNTANDQIYRGQAYEQAMQGYAGDAAATKGQVVSYDGKLLAALYFSSSDGRTRSGEEVWKSSKFPYLQSKPDPYGGGVLRGHGTGMSAQGAIGFARKEGWDFRRILTYYFTGAKVEQGY
jgi:stage II sporulation SpoD-like protein